MQLTVLDALNEFKVHYEAKPEYFSILCPFHGDTHPSATIHQKTGSFFCFTCRKKATLVNYLSKVLGTDIFSVKKKLGARSDCKNPISPSEIEREHEQIWKADRLLSELRFRQINDEIIRHYRLGAKNLGVETRVSIPIINDVGEYASCRLYLPGAKDRKFVNLSGKDRSKIRLFPIEQLEYDTILICGGELKAALAAYILNQYDIGAVAPTCGENVWPADCTEYFRNKLVYINCDDDDTGRKYAEMRCRIFKSIAREVHKVEFPPGFFEASGVKKGDINDFVRLGGNLYDLILKSPEWVMTPGGMILEEMPQEMSFRNAFSHENVSKKVTFAANVSGISSNIYLAPSTVEVKCSRSNGFCVTCDVQTQAFSDNTEMKIGNEHAALLSIINEKTDDHAKTYRKCFNIPGACKECQFVPKEHYSITEVSLDEPLDPTSRDEPQTMRIGYLVNSNISTDAQAFNLTGRLYPMPKNQLKVFLASNAEPTKDTLESYIPARTEELQIFQPKEWTLESLKEKINDIYADLEANVTKIWQRRDYHIALDLAYHSILYIDFGDMRGLNGYVEILVIGDTGQGKSHALKCLKAHYGLGVTVDSKNTSHAGLTIGLEKHSGKRFAVYGTMPKNDRKLVIFEELVGMKPGVFQSLTELRSSGVVQISKIEQKVRPARCRLIAISNPVKPREVASYTFGIEAAIGVIETNEDLRRFDFVQILAKGEIKDLPELHDPPIHEHKYTDELCQKLILKAWKCEKVVFEDTNYILEVTKKLLDVFGNGPPVLDRNSSHIKIAKLSAALAARTCSYELETLIVRKCHVDFIYEYMNRVYSSPSMRLNEKSLAIKRSMSIRDPDLLIEYLKGLANADIIAEKLAEMDLIDLVGVQNLIGDFMQGAALFARLVQSNAITRINRSQYTKNTEFTVMLRTTEFKLKRPEYLDRETF